MQNVLTLARCIVCSEAADLSTRDLRLPIDGAYRVNLCAAHQTKAAEAFGRDRRVRRLSMLGVETRVAADGHRYPVDPSHRAGLLPGCLCCEPAKGAKVVDLVDVLERKGRPDVAAIAQELRAAGAEVRTLDELEPPAAAEVLDEAALERMTLEELAGVRSRIADPIDRIRFDNRWVRGMPVGLRLLALESGATGAE